MLSLGACSDDKDSKDPDAGASPTAGAGAHHEPTASPTKLPSVAGASMAAIPEHGPPTIQGFPVPPGADIKDPGAINDTWQFDIETDGKADQDEVIDFYKRVLPKAGFTIKTDVVKKVGFETVRWDITFEGPVHGTIVRDPKEPVVFVVVNPNGSD